jgi:hypothetical protein
MQNEQLIQQQQQFQVQSRQMELQNTINSEQFRSVASEFDSMVGAPGSFQAEVIKLGQHYSKVEGIDLPTVEAVNIVANNYRKLREHFGKGNSFNAGESAQGNSAVVVDNVRESSKPTIPNIKSRGNSPVQQLPRSIDDIKKIYNSRVS